MIEGYTYPEIFSFSSLSLWHTCRKAWYLKYLRKANTKEGNAFSQYGTFVHGILEKYEKDELPIIALAEEYQNGYDEHVVYGFPFGMGAKYYQDGLDYFENFTGFGEEFDTVGVEEEFTTEIAGHKLTGFVDLILRNKSTGKYTVIDHKSKSKSTLRSDYKEAVLQLYVYAHHVKEIYGEFPERLVFNLFREGEMFGEEFKQSEYDRMVEWVDGTINEIYAATEFPDKIAKDAEDRIKAGKKPLKNNDFFCLRLCDCFDACDLWKGTASNEEIPAETPAEIPAETETSAVTEVDASIFDDEPEENPLLENPLLTTEANDEVSLPW